MQEGEHSIDGLRGELSTLTAQHTNQMLVQNSLMNSFQKQVENLRADNKNRADGKERQDDEKKNADRENMTYEVMDVQELRYEDETFDIAIDKSTMDCIFCCSDSVTMISNMMHEAWRVLKPGGRFGFYEHVEDVDQVIVGKVFGERGVIRVQHVEAKKPGRTNVMAGVVRKV